MTKEFKLPACESYNERQFVRCKECNLVSYYDYLPGGLARPVMTMPCGHGAALRWSEAVSNITAFEGTAAMKAQWEERQQKKAEAEPSLELDIDTTAITSQKSHMLPFYSYCRLATPAEDTKEFKALSDKLSNGDEANRYRHQGNSFPFQPHANRGYTAVTVLPELTGLYWTNLAVAYLHAVRPSSVRVIGPGDLMHCDARLWRVTVHLDDDMRISKIEQEVEIGFGSGYDVGCVLENVQRAKRGLGPVNRTPPGAAIGNMAGLFRVNFD